MNQSHRNKAFVADYLNAISGHDKTQEVLAQYITDQVLIEHIIFFDGAFPRYEMIADEMISEGNQIIVRARMVGKHEGEFGEIPPSHRVMNFPFVVSYVIENNKIISHWLIADQMLLLEQLGVESPVSSAH